MLNIFICSQILNKLFGFNYIQTLLTLTDNSKLYFLNAILLWIAIVILKRNQINNVLRLWNDSILVCNTHFFFHDATRVTKSSLTLATDYKSKMTLNTILCWLKGALENSGLQHKIAWLSFTKCVHVHICAWNLCMNVFMNKSWFTNKLYTKSYKFMNKCRH